MKTLITLLFLFPLLLVSHSAYAEVNTPDDLFSMVVSPPAGIDDPNHNQEAQNESGKSYDEHSSAMVINNEFWYVLFLCTLCISTLVIVLSFLRSKAHSAKDIVNVTGLTLIIFGTIILVMVVNTSEQLTAAIGILGAIAGYLFRSVQDPQEQQSN